MTMADTIQVLLVEAGPEDTCLAQALLEETVSPRFQTTHVKTLDNAYRLVSESHFDVALIALDLEGENTMESVARIHTIRPNTAVIFLAASDDPQLALQAIECGAQDTLSRVRMDRPLLLQTVCQAVERQCRAQELRNDFGREHDDGQLLRSVFDSLPMYSAVLDENGTVLTQNAAWRDFDVVGFLFGPAVCEGRNYLEYCERAPQSVREIAVGALEVVIHQAAEFEYKYSQQAGEETKWFVVSFHAFEVGGKRRILVTHEDITEREHSEEELRNARVAALESSRMKSEFLASMSHEIRTPMNAVMGMTELILDTKLSPEQREYLNIINASSDSLLSLLNDILDFSKIEARKLELESIPFSLSNIIGDTVKTLQHRACQKGINLLYEVPEDIPDVLKGDPSRLRQVLINLMSNSIKFTDDGTVMVRIEMESQTDDAVTLHFSVVDDGIGIKPDKQRVIFESFTQAESSTTRTYGGTGLGLAISAQLVDLMQGKIWVESEEGQGSAFHFTGVFEKGPATNPRSSLASAHELRGLQVLIVDDSESARRTLVESFNDTGVEPVAVSNSIEAVAALHASVADGRPYTIAMVDIQMPDTDGFDLAKKIRADPVIGQTRIVLITAAGQRGDAARSRKLGIEGYLIKPVEPRDLLEAIRVVMALPEDAENRPLVTRHFLKERRRQLNILLAEDDDANRRLAIHLLQKRGHSVTAVKNGEEAVDTLSNGGFDLVLMDLEMPEMDGFEATAAIREREAAGADHVPIIALTAHSMKGDRERCLAAGMDDYLSKPIKAADLFQKIERLMLS